MARSAHFRARRVFGLFLRQGLQLWTSHPLDALTLYLRKFWLFLHGVEIVRDTDAYAVRADSTVLSALLGPRWSRWPDGVLVPLALVELGSGCSTSSSVVG